MKLILTTLVLLTISKNVSAMDIVYRYLTFSIPNNQVRLVGKLLPDSFIINGVKGSNGKDSFEMVLAADFEYFCTLLAGRNPTIKINCKQKDRVKLLDQISTDPTLQRFFNVVDGFPKINRRETESYVLYSAFSLHPMVEGVTSVIVVKHNNDTVMINGFYTDEQLKFLRLIGETPVTINEEVHD